MEIEEKVTARRGSCGDCKFFARLEMQCRKNPPAGMAVPQAGGIAFLQVFPPAKPSDWCGGVRGAACARVMAALS